MRAQVLDPAALGGGPGASGRTHGHKHTPPHCTALQPALRAFVLGANDGLVSVSAIMLVRQACLQAQVP